MSGRSVLPFSFALAGLVGVVLAPVALLMFTKSAGAPRPSPTGALTSTSGPAAQSAVRTAKANDVRLGPGSIYAAVGTVAPKEAVQPVGRSGDSSWIAIRFPPGSVGQGWLRADDLVGLADLNQLAIVQTTLPSLGAAIPSATDAPTNPPVIPNVPNTKDSPQSTPSGPSSAPAADLFVAGVSLLPDGRLSVLVGNKGPGNLSGQPLAVQAAGQAFAGEQFFLPAANLPAGGTVVLQSQDFKVSQAAAIQIVVDPATKVSDPDRTNNSITVTLGAKAAPVPPALS